MTIDDALVVYLKAYTGLSALVVARVFPEELPQGTTLPAVTYFTVSDYPLHTLDGQDELARPLIQFTALGETRSSVNAVGAQIRLALNDYQGTLSGLTIQKIELQNDIPDLLTTADGTTRMFSEDLEYEVDYER